MTTLILLALSCQCPGGHCRPAPAPLYVHPVYRTPAPAPTPPAKRWVWLSKQACYGFGYKRPDGLWAIDPGSKRYPSARAAAAPLGRSQGRPLPSPSSPPASNWRAADPATGEPGLNPAQLAPPDHRQGFLALLNGHRAAHGLAPVGYSGHLESWAAVNCAMQARARASGHYAPNHGWYSVAFWGPSSVEDAFRGWCASPDHNSALLQPGVKAVGLAVTDGNSWTANLGN